MTDDTPFIQLYMVGGAVHELDLDEWEQIRAMVEDPDETGWVRCEDTYGAKLRFRAAHVSVVRETSKEIEANFRKESFLDDV